MLGHLAVDLGSSSSAFEVLSPGAWRSVFFAVSVSEMSVSFLLGVSLSSFELRLDVRVDFLVGLAFSEGATATIYRRDIM